MNYEKLEIIAVIAGVITALMLLGVAVGTFLFWLFP